MISIDGIRSGINKIVVLGNHEGIIQSVLDFDYLSGKSEGSILGIVTGRSGFAKYFWGRKEILIPTLHSVNGFTDLPAQAGLRLNEHNIWLLNLLSGRRTLLSTEEFLKHLPLAYGAALFAENVPELHSQNLIKLGSDSSKLIVGPASVGLLVPGVLKLGPIGGITPVQINESHLTERGSVAVLSASGGMTNELINIATVGGARLSFALSFGGDRFPVLSPRHAFILAEHDPQTQPVPHYREPGDEHDHDHDHHEHDGGCCHEDHEHGH